MAAIEVLARMVRPSPAPEADAPHQLATGTPCPRAGRRRPRSTRPGWPAGSCPSLRQVQREMHLGQPRAREVRSYLTVLAGEDGHN